jgi:hypothetical protein
MVARGSGDHVEHVGPRNMSRDLKDEYFAGLAIDDIVVSKTVVGAPASRRRRSNTRVSRDSARKMEIDETCLDKNIEWLYFIKLFFLCGNLVLFILIFSNYPNKVLGCYSFIYKHVLVNLLLGRPRNQTRP